MSRGLTASQARSCENASGHRCKCRCGGQLHGANRTDSPTSLPVDDPHHADREQTTIFDQLGARDA